MHPQGAGTRPYVSTSIKRSHPPRTPHFNVVHPPGWPRQQTLFFFADEHPPPTSSRTTLKEGGRGGRCGLYQEFLVGRSQARFMTEHCLFFQHRELFEPLHFSTQILGGPGRLTLSADCADSMTARLGRPQRLPSKKCVAWAVLLARTPDTLCWPGCDDA